MNLQFQKTRLTDPLTGDHRPINENMTRQIDINLRHDIPSTQWAYGGNVFQYRQSAGFRLDQRFRFLDTPGSLGLFVEHKDVFGLTVRASVDNLLGTNESFSRTFFDGRRNADQHERPVHRGPRPLLRPDLHADDQRHDLGPLGFSRPPAYLAGNGRGREASGLGALRRSCWISGRSARRG